MVILAFKVKKVKLVMCPNTLDHKVLLMSRVFKVQLVIKV